MKRAPVIVRGEERTVVRFAMDMVGPGEYAMLSSMGRVPLQISPCVPGSENHYWVAPYALTKDSPALAAWAHRLSISIFKGVLYRDEKGVETWIEQP